MARHGVWVPAFAGTTLCPKIGGALLGALALVAGYTQTNARDGKMVGRGALHHKNFANASSSTGPTRYTASVPSASMYVG